MEDIVTPLIEDDDSKPIKKPKTPKRTPKSHGPPPKDVLLPNHDIFKCEG